MKKQLAVVVALVVVICLLAGMAQAQETPAAKPASMTASLNKSLGLYVFPAKEQKPEQQAKDEQACYSWAVEQSGIDPLTMQATKAGYCCQRSGRLCGERCRKGCAGGSGNRRNRRRCGQRGGDRCGCGGYGRSEEEEAEGREGGTDSPADSGCNRCCEDRQFQESILSLSGRERLYRQVGCERPCCMPFFRRRLSRHSVSKGV